MRWIVAIPILFVALVADVSFMPVFDFGGVTPRLVVVVVAFAAMHADGSQVRWFALLAGFLMDLSEPSLSGPRAPLYLIGPSTLGMLFGAEATLSLRGLLIRRNPLAIGVMSLLLNLTSGLFWTAWWALRSWYPDSPPPWGDGSALHEFGTQFFESISAGVFGIPVGWVLLYFAGAWGFPSVLARARTQGGSARIIR